MKKIIPLFVLVAFSGGIIAGIWLQRYAHPVSTEMGWHKAIDYVSPSVVTITGTRLEETTTTTRTGTGIIVSEGGLLVTSKHLLWEWLWYTITLSDGTSYPAHVIKEHPTKDLAILQIISEKKHSFPIGIFANSQASIRAGDTVITIGTMLWLYPWSVVEGTVSWFERTVSFGNITVSWLIQTSIAATLGNSGWPLIQSDGTIIGIMMGIVGGSSQIGWAIPVTQSEITDFIQS